MRGKERVGWREWMERKDGGGGVDGGGRMEAGEVNI
jgi:hypothetical protein